MAEDEEFTLSTGKGAKHGPGVLHDGKPCTHIIRNDKTIEQIMEELREKADREGVRSKRDDELA